MAHPSEGPAHHAGNKFGDILQKDTAGIPNWGWLLIIGAGIVAAYIVPKFLSGGSSSSSSPTTTSKTPDQASSDSGTSNSGLGLAIDPTTGLPYAVEGLVPSGGMAGLQGGYAGLNGGGVVNPGLVASPGVSASPSAPVVTAATDNTSAQGATATTATPDMTSTNNLLQGLLNQLQQGPVPVSVNNTSPIPMVETNAQGRKKTTSAATVALSSHVPKSPVVRPTTPTQPATKTHNPVPSAPKVAPVFAITPKVTTPKPVMVPKSTPKPVAPAAVSVKRPVVRKG